MANAQNDGANKIKRVEFEALGRVYKFILNPEQYNQVEPARVAITQTKGGAWVDDFGAGLPTIEIKGTTGFKNSTGSSSSGFTKFKELRDLVRDYYGKIPPGTVITPDKEMVFHNHTDGESWIVVPKVFSLMRSVSRTLLYLYEIQLICLRPANAPSTAAPTQLASTLKRVSYPVDEVNVVEKRTALEKRIIGHGVSIPIQ
jgi:hypothetical protein